MMARSPSLPLSEYGELSSPDPLASSQHIEDYRYATRSPSPVKRSFSSPTKRQRVRPSTSATPPRTSHSPWLNATSPSKTVTEQTLSPWKIRVTVETEPEDMDANTGAPSSRTIMVPLRDASSPTEERSWTTRGRGSQPNTAKSKRSTTPVRKNSRGRSRRQSVTDINITVLGDEGDSNDWTKQKSPRKRRSTPSRKARPVLDQKEVAEQLHSTTGNTKRRPPKNSRTIEIREDTDAEDVAAVDTVVDSDSVELRNIDLNRVSVRSRSMSSKQRPATLPRQGMGVDEEKAGQDQDTIEDDPKGVSIITTSYPTPDPSVQNDQEVNEPALFSPNSQEAFDTILESEGFTMIDLESIPSARHFLSSPQEAQGTVQSEPATNLQSQITNSVIQCTSHATPSGVQSIKSAPRAIPSYLTLLEGESDISSNVPSSPPVISQPQCPALSLSEDNPPRETTPQAYSSPKLPSPLKVGHAITSRGGAQRHKSTPPTLAKVVKAGIALQGVLSPKNTNMTAYSPGGTPKERLDNLFEGFDSGTRRELRAGLRFGEELAKRQRSSLGVNDASSNEVGLGSNTNRVSGGKHSTGRHVPATQVWREETAIQHTPAQPTLNEEKWESSSQRGFALRFNKPEQSLPRKRSSLCRETKFTSSTPQSMTTDIESEFVTDAQDRRAVECQREREAVSMEIENANSSQIVVIDSDGEDQSAENVDIESAEKLVRGDQDDLDIWCEEAASCDQRSSKAAARPVRTSPVDISPEVERQQQQEQSQDVNKKPRRSVIPSLWRKGEDIADEGSYLTNGDMTGLFYHEPKTKIKFGAVEIERQKRQFSSGSFDIDRVAGTTRKGYPVDSEACTDELDSPGMISSDAQQLQTELSLQNREDNTADLSQAISQESAANHSPDKDAEVDDLETLSELTKGYTSILLPPQPVKIPVNFNDSTVSSIGPCLTHYSPTTAPESSQPSTPRSALKGARQGLSLEDTESSAVRKVIFSTYETRVDLDGQEEQLSMHSASSSPKAGHNNHVEEDTQPSASEVRADSPPQRSGMLGWLWNGNKRTSYNEQDLTHHTTRPATAQTRTPSYLVPPSYPSVPARDIKIPMSTSGDFTNTHFGTLHVIYAKSLRSHFHAPKFHEIRPNLRTLLSTAFEADESQSGLGVFEWKVDETALRVLERFMREVEWGYPAGSEVKWTWTEKDICEKLFRIIVGDEVRREEKAALERAAT